MARKSKAEKDQEFLSKARARFDFAQTHETENRAEAKEDLLFLSGDQWTDEAKEARKNRPMLTSNRMPQFVRQVTGDIKQSRPAITVHPVDSGADPEIAELYQGIIRNIEVISEAKEAYYTAADNQVACGEGYWRVVTDYADHDSFDQDVLIKKIDNPFAVLMDPHGDKQTGEDARWCFVTERMAMDQFKKKYPKASTDDFESANAVTNDLSQWGSEDSIRIAEYWYCQKEPRLLAQMPDGSTIDITDIEEPISGIVKTRKVEQKCWYMAVINGSEVLEEPKKWPGRYLPIVRVMGEIINLGERQIRHGVIRFARDPQRMYNYWLSAQTEIVALQPKAPYIPDVNAIKGYEKYWNVANTADLPYLPYDFSKHPGGPQRQIPPQMSQGMAALLGEAVESMKATTGIYDASLGNRSNETSGRAIMAREQQGDTATYTYHDNFARAIAYTGKILVDLIPKIYDTQRVVRILGADESEEMVAINRVLPTGQIVNDLTVGKYDVTASLGPSFSSQRMQAAEGMLQALSANPALWQTMGDLLFKNLDWPGADEMAERFKKMLPPQLQDQDEQNPQAQQMAMQQAQTQQRIAQEFAKLDMMERAAKIDKLQADTAKAKASAENESAKTQGEMLDNAEQMNNQRFQQAVEQRALQLIQAMSNPNFRRMQ